MEDEYKMHYQVSNTLAEFFEDARMSATSKNKRMLAEMHIDQYLKDSFKLPFFLILFWNSS